MRNARTRLKLTVLAAAGTAALLGTAVAGPATAASSSLQPTAASVQDGGFGPDVAAGKAKPPGPVRFGDGKATAKLASDCSPSSLQAKAAKAKPLGHSAPAPLQGKRVMTCLTVNKPDARIDKASAAARDSAVAKVRAAATAGKNTTSLKAVRAQPKPDGGVQPKANINLPQYCYDHKFQGWWGYRTEQCQIADITIYIYEVSNAAPPVWIGTAKALEYDFTYSTYDIDTFAHQIRVTKYWGERWGNVEFLSSISGFSWCVGDCKQNSDTGLRPGRFAKDVNNDGEAFYDSTRGEPGGIGYNHSHWEWSVQFLGADPSTPREVDAPELRCDNALNDDGNNSGDPAFAPKATLGAGCVFPSITPVMVYTKSGFYPNLARHIEAAQASGLPGAYPNGTVLTRLTDRADKRRNGDTACPPAWVRPNQKSCDEYPFRSTYQGAYTQNPKGTARTFAPPNVAWCEMDPGWGIPTGVTGPNGWSSCMIPATENSSGGSQLGTFYRSNRVLDKDPYRVWIQ